MNNWIEEQRRSLKTIYEQCDNKEPVLKAFSVYLLRILSGLSQIGSSRLYGYEEQILERGMQLFCMHYTERVDSALAAGNSTEEKKRIMRDIEDAISKISNVYKNIIDSTSNSERQMVIGLMQQISDNLARLFNLVLRDVDQHHLSLFLPRIKQARRFYIALQGWMQQKRIEPPLVKQAYQSLQNY